MPTLRQGSSGPDVKDLQQKLKDAGFDPNGVDGNFGPGTRDAVVAFQQSKGLQADGIAGPNTLAVLQSGGATSGADAGGGIASSAAAGSSSAGTTAGTAPALEATVNVDAVAKKLNDKDFQEAANLLKCDVPAIKAVAEVESGGNGFLSDGRVKILFEGHQFYKHAGEKAKDFAKSHPTICYRNWTKEFYATGKTPDIRGDRELARLDEAIALDRTAALMSASYGKFQIMGFNFKLCGFANVEDFYAAMQVSEGEQLKAFCNFIIRNSLDGALRKHQWATLALGYNGEGYKKNKYDTKLAAAFAKYSKQ